MSDIYTIAKSGLKAYKEGLATTGQNIANVGNEAYSRREAAISEIKSGSPDVLQLSENMSFGVKVDGITRAFDQFIDIQLQNAKSNFSFSQTQTQIFNQLENIVRPETGSVSQRMNEFFAALSTVAQDPSNLAGRYGAIDSAKAITHAFRTVGEGIIDLKSFVSENLKANIADANSYIQQLSNIQRELLGNKNPSGVRNDLLDQRDRLLGQLSEIVEIKVNYKNHGEIEILAGTEGQGQQVLSGFEIKKFSTAEVDDLNKVFIGPIDGDSGTMVQISSGKVAGNLSSEYALKQTKVALDGLAQKFVAEINEVQTSGIDLDGNIGEEFFTLDALRIEKKPGSDSNVQLEIFGTPKNYINQTLSVQYVAEADFWQLRDTGGSLLSSFKGAIEFDGIKINVVGEPGIGDQFDIIYSDVRAENLSLKINDGKKLAASAYYLAAKHSENISNVNVSTKSISQESQSDLTSLNNVLVGANNAAHPITFRKNGVLGVIQNVDALETLTALKQQTKLQLSTPISNLTTTSQLKVTVGATEHSFTLGTHAGSIKNYMDLAKLVNTGVIKTDVAVDGKNLTFSDLGLMAGGNETSFIISSAFLGNTADYLELKSGSLSGIAGLIVPGNTEAADLQILTKEGVHLAGTPLSQTQIQSLVSTANGFSAGANYNAQHLANEDVSSYAGAKITRLTTSGSHVASISSLAKSNIVDSNLDTGDMANIPNVRSKMSGPLTIESAFGDTVSYEASQGMMAGQIASALNTEVAKFGIRAEAYNNVELYDIPSKSIQFKLAGDNAEPIQISADLSSGNLQLLVDQINSVTKNTGIQAALSHASGIVLTKADGNDIRIESVSVADAGNFKLRQLDRFGEVIASPQNNANPILSTGKYAIIGGQIELRSPSAFKFAISGVETPSQTEEFANGFVKRNYLPLNGSTSYSFQTLKAVDQASTGAEGLISVAPSSSYEFKIKGDNSSSELKAKVLGANGEDLTSDKIAASIAADLRKLSPQAGFTGDTFSFADGFPKNGDSLEFRLGDQLYRATLNNVPEYIIEGSNVLIGGISYNQADALKHLVSVSNFTVTGPENNRIRVGFKEVSGGFQLYAVANDGVISGHSLRLSNNNPAGQLSAFHTSNSSSAFIQGSEFDTQQAVNVVIAQLIVGDTITDITFNNGTITPTSASGAQISLESTGTNKGRLKIIVPNTVADKDIRLRATANSTNFGINSASTQLTVTENGFKLSEYGVDRIEVNATVKSLASEAISIENLSGEDLIVIATGNTRPSILGAVKSSIKNLDSREITASVISDDGKTIELTDTKTGDYLGSRTISGTNAFQYNGFEWQFDGIANKNDQFTLRTTGDRQDDASNLVRFNALASLSKETGKGGYSEIYSNLVTETGFKSRAAEQRYETTEAIHEVALDRKSEFAGVDLDTEAARLLEQQQAYQALAKVLSTAKELVDTLLRSF